MLSTMHLEGSFRIAEFIISLITGRTTENTEEGNGQLTCHHLSAELQLVGIFSRLAFR